MYHIIITWDRSSMKIYVNGILSNINSSCANANLLNSLEPVNIGRETSGLTSKLHIPCFKLKGAVGEELHYEVDMQYKPLSQPMTFQLTGAKPK